MKPEPIGPIAPQDSRGPLKCDKRHIDLIQAGDTVWRAGKLQTVCAKDLHRCAFMGRSLFGDTYRLGRDPVFVVNWRKSRRGIFAQAA